MKICFLILLIVLLTGCACLPVCDETFSHPADSCAQAVEIELSPILTLDEDIYEN